MMNSTSNRHFNTPSPVVFPSASPTPKLFSTPSKKLAEVKKPWQELGIESVPQNSANGTYHHDDTTAIIYSSSSNNIGGGGEREYHHHNYCNNSREKYITTPTISSPLSLMMESDTLLDDEDISSYKFSEEDYLSSIISSRPPSSISTSPLRRRPVSFSSPSPQLLDQLNEEEDDDNEEPIVGSPFSPVPNDDPIIERPRRFSFDGPLPSSYYSKNNSNKAVDTKYNAGAITAATATTKKLGFGKNFLSKMKTVAASGKPSSIFK
jgi:hypothetical protein